MSGQVPLPVPPMGPAADPGWYPGYVPSANEWAAWWSNKLDTDDAKLEGAPWLSESGGVMTGPLTLYGPPTQPLEAVTKAYVDQFTPASGPFLPMSGGTMTGMLTLASNPVGTYDAVPKIYADAIATTANNALNVGNNALSRTGGTMTGALILSGDPALPLGAATKQYVDRFLPLTGGTVSGGTVFQSNLQGNAIYATLQLQIGSFNGWEWGFSVDAATGSKWQQFRSGWANIWDGTTGMRGWYGPSGALMTLSASGQLNITGNALIGSSGINYKAFGGHNFAFGWNGNVNLYVDGTYEGDVAYTGWVSSVLGGYLPLSGGHITGSLGVDGSVLFGQGATVQGTLGIGSYGAVGSVGWYYSGFGPQHGIGFWYPGGSGLYARIDGATDVPLGTASDASLKQDIAPSQMDCLDVVRRTKLFQFRWKEDGADGMLMPVGFIAQEQQKVLPEAVGGELTLGINLQMMVAALFGAVQVLADRLDAMTGAAKEA